MRRFLPAVFAASAALVALLPASCSTKQPTQSTYFDRTISPILTTSCVRTNTGAGCHVADAKGNALGNLDVATFEGVQKRRDLLLDYGPYGQPAFLVKNVDPFQVEVQTFDGKKIPITTDIKHAGGSILDPTGSAYRTLRRWIQDGATENNTGQPPPSVDTQPCSTFIPTRAEFDLTKDPPNPDFAEFRDKVNPVITGSGDTKTKSCAAGNCHGTVANALYFTCGGTPEQLRWNYLAAEEYLAQTPEQSELVRRPLSPAQGGAYHEGGIIFESPSDPGYVALSQWAQDHGPPKLGAIDPGFAFYSEKVQPMLVKKGCMMVQCHSASMFHDYRLRGGSGGSFSLSATRKNYELSLLQLSLESDDPNASRLIKKNLYRAEACAVAGCAGRSPGLAHRGGSLFEDFRDKAATPDACAAGNYDYDNGELDKIPAYCVVAEWLRRERDLHKLAPLSAVVYVKRPAGSVKRATDYDVYSPGADLRRVSVTLANGKVTAGTDDKSLTAGCGLDPATADIRRPQVSYDGTQVVFAARASASEPLAVYEMNADGTACAKHAEIDATPPTQNGLLVHNFDPVYAPPEGGVKRIVFASSRGNVSHPENFDYSGPQRQPADPTKPNADLFVWEPDPAAPGKNRIRQLTSLLDLERMPSFMADGRLIFTAQKREPSFYQLSLRRQNLDGSDYHPLYAQRSSVAYSEATSVVELADKNFLAIFGEPTTPQGGGVLGTFNRSLGIDFQNADPASYLIDASVIDPAAPASPDPRFFLHSLSFPDPGANARPGQPTTGLYASPSALPDALALVSFGAASDPGAFGGDYDLYVIDPASGRKDKLLGDAGSAEVDAVGVYAKFVRPIFHGVLDEPNGHSVILDGHSEAEVTVLDMRVLASLLFQNTPTGRVIDPDVKTFSVYEELPPPLDVDSFDKGGANVATDAFGKVYVRRRLLGVVPIEDDGSAKFNIPGGVPIVLALPETKLSRERNLPRVQREEMLFVAGEYAHQSFKQDFFGALCGTCHGSVSGRPVDAALNPDFVTRASDTIARAKGPLVMAVPPDQRGAIEGPPAGP